MFGTRLICQKGSQGVAAMEGGAMLTALPQDFGFAHPGTEARALTAQRLPPREHPEMPRLRRSGGTVLAFPQ